MLGPDSTRKVRPVLLTVSLLLASVLLVQTRPVGAQEVSWLGTELLAKATNTSITINVVPADDVEIRYLYGTSDTNLNHETEWEAAEAGAPHNVTLTGLTPNTRYHYRMEHRADPGSSVTQRDIYTFRTGRANGCAFTFTVISDSHLDASAGGGLPGRNRYFEVVANVASDKPDLHFDLGDTFMIPFFPANTQAEVDNSYLNQRGHFGVFSHSTPVYIALGNHEQEEGWWHNSDIARFGIEARKAFFPSPTPDDGPFFSANEDPWDVITRADDQWRENYYAFEWGDALFVVLDPFHYTTEKPYNQGPGDPMNQTPGANQWSWTHGIEQYLWFKDLLEDSDKPFKFVFSHHVTGGQTDGAVGLGPGYVRGGATAADYFEWGGQNADGTWGWDDNRPAAEGWDRPIHQLMLDAEVTAYFHGHDHQYAYEEVTGTKTEGGEHTIVYLEVPQAGDNGQGFQGIYDTPLTQVNLSSAGHVRMTVDPVSGEATGEYVAGRLAGEGPNGEVRDSWVADGAATGTNQPPSASDVVVTVPPDETTAIDVLANDEDPDCNELSIESVTPASNGSVVNNTYHVTYTPEQDYCGNDSFAYTVTNGESSDTAAVTVTVTCPSTNSPPIAVDDEATTTQGEAVVIDVLANDSDPDGDPLTVVGVSEPLNGSATINPDNTITYTPTPTLVGIDTFIYTVSDGALTATATVTVTVTAAPPSPPAPPPPPPPPPPPLDPEPLPPGGTFIDDDGNTHEGNIEAIVAAGITRGCNPPANNRYCPGDPVTRGQIAAFLVRGLGLTDDGGRDWFTDANGHTFERDLNIAAAAGILRGCNPPANNLSCVDDLLTRGQMAALIVRAFGLTDDGGRDWFVDDDGHTFEGDINKLAQSGVTRGCNPPDNDRFCPDDPVLRDQMASFLARAFGLDPISVPPR